MIGPNFTRVAVVQLDYHPAALIDDRPLIEDPLGGPSPIEVDHALLEQRDALRDRVVEQYLDALRPKVVATLEACRAWNVAIVVFPEYSIPWQLLETVAEQSRLASDMLIVAGTHTVDGAALDANVYGRLGLPADETPSLRQAVAPIFHSGGLIQCVGKVSPNKEEREDGSFVPAQRWELVPSRTEPDRNLAVVICFDFLYRDEARQQQLIGGKLSDARLCAVPCLSPWHSTDEFEAKSLEQARRYGRPVLFANIASAGGSTIFVDDDRGPRSRAFPTGLHALQPGEEGVLVANIDLGSRSPGGSTRYKDERPVRTFAAATFAYRHTEPLDEYAQWSMATLERLHEPSLAPSTRKEIKKWLAARGTQLPQPATLRRRMRELPSRIDNIATGDKAAPFVREVMMPPHALPLPLVRHALARGSDLVISSWQRHHQGLDPARARLHEAILEDPTKDLLPPAAETLRRLTAGVVGDVDTSRDDRPEFLAVTQALIKRVSADDDAVDTDIREGELARAERSLRQNIEDLTSAGVGPELHSARLRLAGVLTDQQRVEEVRAVLDEVDPGQLDQDKILQLARAWASVARPSRGRAVLRLVTDRESEGFAKTIARLQIAEGIDPSELPQGAGIRAAAAWLQLRRGDMDEASRRALLAMQDARTDGPLASLGPFVVLAQALHLTVFEALWINNPIAISQRRPVIAALEAALQTNLSRWVKIAAQPGAEGICDALHVGLVKYAAATEPPDPQRFLDPVPPAPPAIEEPDHHPWISDFQQAAQEHNEGRHASAQALIEPLARTFPKRAPIERLLAILLLEAGELEAALIHAQLAFEQVPGGGFRLLLATILRELGKQQEAWDIIEVGLDRTSATVVDFAGRLCDRYKPERSLELWETLVALEPNHPYPLVRLAAAQSAQGEKDAAAETAWGAFELLQSGDHKTNLEVVALVGRLQVKGGWVSTKHKKRIRAVAQALQEQFPTGIAEQARVSLLLHIGDPVSINGPLLVEEGLAIAIRPPEFPQWLAQSEREERFLRKLYSEGGISIAGLARAERRSIASVFCQIWDDPTLHFCGYIPLQPTEILDLAHTELLVGAAEMLILAELGLFEALEQLARESEFRILIPEKESTRLSSDYLDLPDSQRPHAKHLNDAAWEQISTGRVRVATATELNGADGPNRRLPPSRFGEAYDRVLRCPLRERIDRASALRGNPLSRRALSVDLFAASGIGHVDIGRSLQWSSPGEFQQVVDHLRGVEPLLVSVPELVRALQSYGLLAVPHSSRIQHLLASQGFSDALSAREIIASTEVDAVSAQLTVSALTGIEALARDGGRSSAPFGRITLANKYARAIVQAFLGEGEEHDSLRSDDRYDHTRTPRAPLAPGKRTAVLSRLLARLEELDTRGGNSLDLTLNHIGLAAADRWKEAFTPSTDNPNEVVLDDVSPPAALWTELDQWAGKDRSRRAALDRALCTTWTQLDLLAPPTDSNLSYHALLLARSHSASDWSLSISHECLAILSSNWAVRPLKLRGRHLHLRKREGEGPSYDREISWEELLCEAAQALSTTEPIHGGRNVAFDFDDGGELPAASRFWLPADAVVLRMEPDRAVASLKHLLDTQGPQDGRTLSLLQDLMRDPANKRSRKDYARHTANALWRRLRDDPSYLLRWPHQVGVAEGGTPPQADALCQMLHEPDEPVAADSLSALFDARAELWHRLPASLQHAITSQAASIPGASLYITQAADFCDIADVTPLIEEAVYRLDHADAFAAGRLAQSLQFLTIAATHLPETIELHRGSVELREIIPDLFIRAFEQADSSETAGGFAAHEADMLRACAATISHILRFAAGRTERDYLWLTYRFYGWFTRQLEFSVAASRDSQMTQLAQAARVETLSSPSTNQLFDPLTFSSSGLEYRKITLFGGLLAGLFRARHSTKAAPDASISTPGLERWMLEQAAAPCAPPQPREDTWIDWPWPITVPDLASYWLLNVNPERFFTLSSEQLIERINRWPDTIGDLAEGDRDLIEIMARGFALLLDRLNGDVLDAFETRLLSLKRDEIGGRIVALGLASLYASGRSELRSRVHPLLDTLLDDSLDTLLLGYYFTGLARDEPKALQPEVERLLHAVRPSVVGDASEAATQGIDRVIGGLGRATILAKQPSHAKTATDALKSLAARPDLCNHEGLRDLLKHLTGGQDA